MESVAKYVGVDACTLLSSDMNDIEAVLSSIYKFIANSETIIVGVYFSTLLTCFMQRSLEK